MPDLPLSFDDAKQTAGQVEQAVEGLLNDYNVPGFLRVAIAGIIASIVLVGDLLILLLVKGLVRVATPFATAILEIIGKARTENADQFNEVIAASLSEMLGVEITGDDLPSGKGTAATVDRMRAIGGKVHDLLIREFTGAEPDAPGPGEQAARAFTGFGVNFAVSNSFVSILSEALTVGVLKEFRELGVETASALGLGRLQRLALQPLMQNLVVKPYDKELRKRYRQDNLAEGDLVKGMHAGYLTEDDVREQLAQKGYPDVQIGVLMQLLTPRLSTGQATTLRRYGELDQESALAELQLAGVPIDKARLMLRAVDLGRADNELENYVALLVDRARSGFIERDTFDSLLNAVPLIDTEKQWIARTMDLYLATPRSRLTLAQLTAAYVNGDLDLDYVDQWMSAQGYDDTATEVLELGILRALDKEISKEKAAEQKAARAAAKPPKTKAPA